MSVIPSADEFPLSVEECVAAGYAFGIMRILQVTEAVRAESSSSEGKLLAKLVMEMITKIPNPTPEELIRHVASIIDEKQAKKLEAAVRATLQ